MDQIKIGRFIAEERKKKNLTQRQLADILGISDKTVSKWERGNGFPEISLLLPLCSELEISVNELLSGERLQEVDYKEKAEENMMNLIRKSKATRKERIITTAITIAIVVVALAGGIVGRCFPHPEAQAAGILLVLISEICFAGIWATMTLVLRKDKD